MKRLIFLILASAISVHGQMLQSVVGSRVVSGGNVTVGLQTNSGNDGGGDSGAVIYIPVQTPDGASGYTLNTMTINHQTASGNEIRGLYNSTNSGCTNQDVCPGTRLCQTASTAATSGDQVLTPVSCGTQSARSIYWIALKVDNDTMTYGWINDLGCPANGLPLQTESRAAFTLPATAASGGPFNACIRAFVNWTCVGTCGSTYPTYTVVDYSGGTATNTPTAATMNSSTHCKNGQWAIGNGGALTNMTYQSTPAPQAFVNSAFATCNQTTYTGAAPGLVIKRITGANDQFPNDALNYGIPTGLSGGWSGAMSMGVWIQTDTPQNISNGAFCDVTGMGVNTSGLATHIAGNGTNLFWQLEHVNPTRNTNGPALSTSTWYWVVSDFHASGTIRMAIYDTTGAQVGSTVTDSGTTDTSPVSLVSIGNQGSCFASPVNNIWYAGIKIDPGDSFPVLAGVYPDSPFEIGPVLAGLVHDGIVKSAEIRDGRWYSNALGRFLD